MKRYVWCLSVILSLGSIGCENINPEFTDLSSFGAPTFSGKTEHSIEIENSTTAIPISGECNTSAEGLYFMVEGQTNWGDAGLISSGAPTINCSSDGTFNFNLKSVSDLGFDGATAHDIRILAKAYKSGLESSSSTLLIKYTPAGQSTPPGYFVSSGGGKSLGTNLMLRGRIKSQQRNLSSSSGFILKSGIRQ